MGAVSVEGLEMKPLSSWVEAWLVSEWVGLAFAVEVDLVSFSIFL